MFCLWLRNMNFTPPPTRPPAEILGHLKPSIGVLSSRLSLARMRVAAPYLTGRSVLDAGCNIADLLQFLPADIDYVGLEWVPEIAALARWRFPEREFVVGDVGGQWPEAVRSRKFDHVVMLAVVEHLKHPEVAFSQARQVLSPAGTVVLTTPHARARQVHALGARLGIFSRDADAEHEVFLDRSRIEALAEKAGLVVATYRTFQLGVNQLVVLRARP